MPGLRPRQLMLVPPLIAVALALAFAPVAVLLAAPWLAFLVWCLARGDVATGDDPAFPSLADDARRRLSAR